MKNYNFKNVLLIGFAISSILSPLSNLNAQIVDTNVDSDVDVDFFYRGEHPRRWNPFKTICGGRNTETNQANQDIRRNADNQMGTLDFNANKPGWLSFRPQQLKWNSQISENLVFKIDFSQNVQTTASRRDNRKCSKHRWNAKVRNIDNKFESKMTINVPENVFVVAVRQSVNKRNVNTQELKLVTEGISGISKLGYANKEKKNILTKEWTYHFVIPGQSLVLGAEYRSKKMASASFVAEMELFFVGANRCNELLGDPAKINFEKDSFVKLISAKEKEDFNRYALKVACVRNPAYLNKIVYENHAKDVTPVIRMIEDEKAKITPRRFRDSNIEAVKLILSMTSYEISKYLLNDLGAYCQTSDLMDLDSILFEDEVKVKRFVLAGMEYGVVNRLLNVFPVESMDKFSKALVKFRSIGMTYNEIMEIKENKETLQLFQKAILRENLDSFYQILDIMDSLPKTKVGERDRLKLLSLLEKAQSYTEELGAEVRRQLLLFGRRPEVVVNGGKLVSKVEQLKQNLKQIENLVHIHFGWFAMNLESNEVPQMYSDMIYLADSVLYSVGEALNSQYGFALKSFIDYENMQTMHKTVTQCLDNQI